MKYKCENCGFEIQLKQEPIKCTSCGEFGTMLEVCDKTIEKKYKTKKAQRLKDVSLQTDVRLNTGIGEFDRVMGEGTVNDSVTILTGTPGCGKSTLILNVASKFAQSGLTVLYVTSEESKTQVKKRAQRILSDIPDELYIHSTKETYDIKALVEDIDPQVIFVDSISAFRSEEFNSPSGSITQTRAVSEMLIEICKQSNKPRAAFIIAHVTKDDELAGSRALEHDVDTVLYLDGSSSETLRILRSVKNRFGELTTGLFRMEEKGMIEISDPSEFFITKRQVGQVPKGVAVSVVKDGNRSIAVEVEALSAYSAASFPQRVASCLRKDNLNIIISIIESTGLARLDNKSVYINVPGGLKLSTPATDLAIAMSICSHVLEKPIDHKTVFIGEIGLTGELRKVVDIDQRVRELERLGYETAVVPKGSIISSKVKMKVVEFQHLKDVINKYCL